MRGERRRRTRLLLAGDAQSRSSDHDHSRSESQQAIMYVVLEALDGPSVGARTNVAAGQTVRVGREAGNDFVVPQDPTLSRCHFHLYYDGSNCLVLNQSRYGTFVNNQRVDAEGSVRDGDELRAGVCRFAVRFASDESVRNSTSPEMLAIRDDAPPAPSPNYGSSTGQAAAMGVAGLPPIVEDEPVAEPTKGRAASPSPYGLPPIEEDEPIAEPGQISGTQRGVDRRATHLHAVAPASATSEQPQIGLDADGLRSEPVAELLSRVRLEDDAKPVAATGKTASGVIEALASKGLVTEAMKVLAAALPPQAAVLWAVRCVRETGDLSKGDVAALTAAERWAAESNEQNRRAAQSAAETLEYGTAASWAAVSAFWSGGSMAPPNVPAVPPPPYLMPQALIGALSLAAIAQGGEKAEEMQKRFLAFGLEARPKAK